MSHKPRISTRNHQEAVPRSNKKMCWGHFYISTILWFYRISSENFIFARLFERIFANIYIENKQHIVVIDWDCLRVLEPWLKSTLSFYFVQACAKHALNARNTPRRKWNLNLKNIPRAIPIFLFGRYGGIIFWPILKSSHGRIFLKKPFLGKNGWIFKKIEKLSKKPNKVS